MVDYSIVIVILPSTGLGVREIVRIHSCNRGNPSVPKGHRDYIGQQTDVVWIVVLGYGNGRNRVMRDDYRNKR